MPYCLLLLLFNRCTSSAERPPIPERNNVYNRALADSAASLLQTGDLVLRSGADMTSYMLRQLNTRNKTYSHCGLVVVENGKAYIYHSIGGEENPDEKLRKDPAVRWFSPAGNMAIGIARFSFDSLQQKKLVAILKQWHGEQKKFDMRFDLATDDRFYCSEMVYKAISGAVNDTTFLRPLTLFGYRFIAIDDLFLHPHADMICQLQYK